MLLNGLLALVLTACQLPTSGSGLSLTPVVTLGRDAAGVAGVRIRVPDERGDRHVQSMPASWNEAVVYFDSPTASVYPYAFTIPRTAFTQVGSGIVSSLPMSLSVPQGLAWDRNGDLLVGDMGTDQLLRYNVGTGVTTTVAGTGTAGYSGDGGPATSAQLDDPLDVVADSGGNIYLADVSNHRVRRIDAATGVITTYVGTGAVGTSGDGGLASAATLNQAECLAIDAADNLYISDGNAHRVRKVDAVTKVITTVVGTGTSGFSGDGGAATAAKLSGPEGVFVDGAGNLFVSDTGNQRVRKVNASTGVITTIAGTGTAGYSGDGGPATSAKLNIPIILRTDPAGHLYIGDMLNHVVRKVDAVTGVITTIAGTGSSGYSGDGGPATSAKFNQTGGLALDSSGTLYIGDVGNARLRQVSGGYSEFVASTGSTPAMPVLRPATDYAISVDLRTSGSPATLEALGFLGAQTLQAGPNTFTLSLLDNLNVSSLAGDPTIRDGTGAAAFFDNPMGVAVDAAGTYAYVADYDNNCIRRLEITTGIVTTIGGNGRFGLSNGTAANSRFDHPIALSLVGTNLYVVDMGNSAVRKIDLALASTNASFVSTLAGGNGWGYADGNAATAKFASPEGLVADPGGTAIYVVDPGNHRIRKIDLTLASTDANFVTSIAGSGTTGNTNGTGTAAKFNHPCNAALDGAGNLYVTDFWNGSVRKIVIATQVVTTLATLGGTPYGIAFDGTDLWVSEHAGSGRIRKVTLGGTYTTVAGGTVGYADGTGAGASFSFPSGLSVIPGGDLLIADRDNHAIRRMVRVTGAVTTLAGSQAAGWVDGPLAAAKFRSIKGVCLNRANTALYVADTGNQRIRKIDLVTGMVSTVAGNGFAGWVDATGAAAKFYTPWDVAINDAGTTLYVSDLGNYRIRQIDLASGAVATLAGASANTHVDGTGTAARFTSPAGMAIDASGNLYIAERYSATIRKVTSGGVVTTIAGSAGSESFANGVGSAARFYGPVDVALDRMGCLYVAEWGNRRVRRIQLSSNTVSTLAGSSTSGSADGPGASATFTEPWGVACDGGGNVYVADIYTRKIRKIARDGYVTTVAGGSLGYQDGFRTTARFSAPVGLAVDSQGSIYVGETDNQMVRRIK